MEHGNCDGLTRGTLRRRPLACRVENPLEEGDVDTFTVLIGDVRKKTGIVVAGRDGGSGCGTNVSLDGLNVRLKGTLNPVPLGYLLRVRREDLTRRRRGGVGERDVVKVAIGAPVGEMTGARDRSAVVALSS